MANWKQKKKKLNLPSLCGRVKQPARPVGFLYFLLSEPFDRIRRLG
jgi:hypothetical protein